MKIAKLIVENYGPFWGRHELDVTGSDVFAVTARYEGDSELSNWGGKSYLVHAIPLALINSFLSETADGWISDGADEGKVENVLDSGISIARSRKRGSSTQLVVTRGDRSATGDAAQTSLETGLGINKDNFFSTGFIAQKTVNRFVVARPTQRLQIVSEWIGAELEKLKEARANAGKHFTAARRARDEKKAKLQDSDSHVQAFSQYCPSLTLPEALDDLTLNVILKALQDSVDDLREASRASKERVEKASKEVTRMAIIRAEAVAFSKVATEGKEVQKELAAMKGKNFGDLALLEKNRDEERRRRDNAREELDRCSGLTRGEFGGKCPVNGRDCPVTLEINGDGKRNRIQFEKAKLSASSAEERYEKVNEVFREGSKHFARKEALEKDLKRLAAQGRALKASFDAAPKLTDGEDEDVFEAYKKTLETISAKEHEADAFKRWWKILSDNRERNEKATAELEKLETALRVAGDQVEVLARAERTFGQSVLLEVESLANTILSDGSIDLTVRMSWGRETGQLETDCHRCGWRYPRGRAKKVCEDCGADRLPSIEERLDLIPSARSDGAAEDLAGLAVYLAAAAWRRRVKGIRWGVLVLDEVTASLDTGNRKAISRVLAKMIRSAGFEQAFVISHSADVTDALPGKIEIVAKKVDGGVRSTVKVL